MLSSQELYRYCRQINLPPIGVQGQEKLKKARVLCIGAGGLGSPALLYLAAAGVGQIGIVDDDVVDISNLPRQILYADDTVKKAKAGIAQEVLRKLNPEVTVVAYDSRFSVDNALAISQGYDIIIDGTDNFASKYLINSVAVKLNIPMVYGSILAFEGRVAIFGCDAACYQCVYPTPPATFVPNCAELGVLGPLAGMIGCMQALETIKLLVANAALQTLSGKMWVINVADFSSQYFTIHKNKDCPLCSLPADKIHLANLRQRCSLSVPAIDPDELSDAENYCLLDVREWDEYYEEHIPGALHLPLSKIKKGDLLNLNRQHNYLIYCHQGVRSEMAAQLLRQTGFVNISHLKGGIVAWKNRKNNHIA